MKLLLNNYSFIENTIPPQVYLTYLTIIQLLVQDNI